MIQPRVGGLVALTIGVLSCTGAAFGQTTGADVIVGDLPGISDNGVTTVNGVTYEGFAVGTTSCNKGNTPLNWFTGGTDNRHPVIGQNLFRLRNGQFEQVGQGWLKHGFTALQGTICQAQFGFNCSATAGTTLGVGCSDPYSAGLNNVVGNGGPKWQVNASTGLFPYPFTATGSAPIRVRTSDLAAGDRYFVEGQYVCGDDAQVNGGQNKFNNASWEEVSYNSGTGAFSIVGSTTREQGAIYAWRAIDPTVTITTFDVPNDGRFILACKVTGTGPYTYEYALHNLNSHRCAGSFIVPLPGTQSALSNVGFHDAECVGEPNQLANPTNPASDDWAVSGTGAGSTSVAWAGPLYNGTPPTYILSSTPYMLAPVTSNPATSGFTAGTGNDHTANVIRWGNLFNFRFTCNAAPATGTVAVGLFRPGTGNSFTMTIPTPGGATNGTLTASCCNGTACSVATQAACGTGTWGLPGSTCSPDPCAQGTCCVATTGACSTTTSSGCIGGTWTANASCNPNPCAQPATGSCCVQNTGACSVTTQANCAAPSTWANGGSCSPNICAVASGACCVASACSVTTAAACSGTFMGNATTCAATVCPSGNDLCASALGLCDGLGIVGTTVGAQTDGTASCATNSVDVWYFYTPATSATIVIDTCTASFDTVLSIFTGNCGSQVQVQCNDDSNNGTCGTGNNLHSRISFAATAGVRYLVRVSGYQGATGTFTVKATGGGGSSCNSTGRCCVGTGCTITTSTACSGAFTSGGTCASNPCDPTGRCCVGTTCTSTTQTACTGTFTSGGTCTSNPCNPTGTCCTGTTCTSTLQSACAGTFVAGATCGTNTCNPAGGCCTSGNCTAVNQSACVNGVFTVGGSCTPNPCAPLSDDCANRQGVPSGATPFDTTNATTDGIAHNPGCLASGSDQIYKDVWFNFPCTFDGTIDIDTCGTTFDTKIAVYSGTGCTDFASRLLACNDDNAAAVPNGCGTASPGNLDSWLSIPVVCGQHYTIRVGAFASTVGGPGTLNITPHPNALGTCCAVDGSCSQSQQSCCVGTWTVAGTCTPNTCPQPTGACCVSGVCSIQTHLACGGANYQGDNSVCSPNPCPQTSGACCVGTACSITVSTACAGSFRGAGTVCGPVGNPTTCCKANYNQVNGVNVTDIFDFLAGFFAADPRADFDGNGVINVQDIFDFLSAWFVGC